MRPFFRTAVTAVLIAVLPGLAAAQGFMREPPSRGDRAGYFQTKGEDAFKRGRLESAAYRWEISAYWGGKLAQYNLGLMYFKGTGVTMDRPRGVAFLAVAAERNDEPFVRALEWAYAQLTPDEIARANAIWRTETRPRYADKVALVRAGSLFRMDAAMATGSHTGHVIGNLEVYGEDFWWEDGMNRQRTILERGPPAANSVFPRVEVGDLVPLEGRLMKKP